LSSASRNNRTPEKWHNIEGHRNPAPHQCANPALAMLRGFLAHGAAAVIKTG